MKKLFFAVAFACTALFTACTTDDDTTLDDTNGQVEDDGTDSDSDSDDGTDSDSDSDDGSTDDVYDTISASYVGALTVSDAEGNVNYTDDDTTFDFEAAAGFGELVMNEVKFAEAMPFPMTISASDIPYISDGVYEIDSVIPTIAGAPMESYIITNLKIEATDSTLIVEFECYGSYAKFTTEVEQETVYEKILVESVGTMTVEDLEGTITYTQELVTFNFEAANGFGELVMNDIKFTSSSYAPTMTLVVSDIEYVSDGLYSAATIVPTWNGESVDSYAFSDLQVELVDSVMSVSFGTSNSKIKFVSE